MANTQDFMQALDKACVKELEQTTPRGHLGASQIGRKCARQIWYGYNWVYEEPFDGRMQRLFSRGHEEEFRFVRWLRAMGAEVQDYRQRLVWCQGMEDPQGFYDVREWDRPLPYDEEDVSTSRAHIELALEQDVPLKQWGFSLDIGEPIEGLFDPRTGDPLPPKPGHYAGSTDGRVRGVEKWIPEVTGLGWGLLEFKTHSYKSFQALKLKGVVSSKPEHYVQMQEYMHFMGLKWALYMATCKNDDHIHVEVVHYKPEIAIPYAERAMTIIQERKPPVRITNDPSWFECKWCPFSQICHYDEPMLENCRSCTYSSPEQGGKWACNLHRSTIPLEFYGSKCAKWEQPK